jgi:hypothetical protein
MGGRSDSGFETYHLTCPVCGALPRTTCIDENYRELEKVHPSRRMSIVERNQRSGEGWEPPELEERHRAVQAARAARAPLFDPLLKSGTAAVRKARRLRGAGGSAR